MTALRLGGCCMAAALWVLPGALAQTPDPASLDAAFQRFRDAASPSEAAQRIGEIEKTGVSFEESLRRLRAGRTYTAQSAGVIRLKNKTEDGVEHFFTVTVPPGYDPARWYQVRFQLHGGIGGRGDNQPRGTGEIGTLAGAEQFYVIPYAWDAAPWWGDDQVLNLHAIVDTLKRTYNIDENRVVVAGVSDGATGAYYIAMRDTTPYASFLPLNGFLMVLANGEIDDGRIFPNNLLDKPLFVVNGGKDRLYPISIVEPFTKHLMASGVSIDYHPQPEGEHNTRWWPEIKGPFETFVAGHPRDPNPDKLTWQAADAAHNRAHWLILDRFGAAPREAKNLPDVNEIGSSSNVDDLQRGPMFGRSPKSGRVDLVRMGNTVQAATSGVAAFTLLLSADKFDFNQPIRVVANGREVFNAKVDRSVSTLLKWAARDNDRTMLYAAELPIKLGK